MKKIGWMHYPVLLGSEVSLLIVFLKDNGEIVSEGHDIMRDADALKVWKEIVSKSYKAENVSSTREYYGDKEITVKEKIVSPGYFTVGITATGSTKDEALGELYRLKKLVKEQLN